MTYQIYCLMDRPAGLFLAPMIDVNEATCKRNVAIQIERSTGALNFAPKDYDLYRLGSFTDSTGVIECEAPFEFVCNCESLVGE